VVDRIAIKNHVSDLWLARFIHEEEFPCRSIVIYRWNHKIEKAGK
jgi:hypothetical protein